MGILTAFWCPGWAATGRRLLSGLCSVNVCFLGSVWFGTHFLFHFERLVVPRVIPVFTFCPSFPAFNDYPNVSHLCLAVSEPWLVFKLRSLSPLRQIVLSVLPARHQALSPVGLCVFWPVTFGLVFGLH